MNSRREEDPTRVQGSSVNVFADLGLPNPEQAPLKVALTLRIFRVLKGRPLTQAQAGKRLGIPPA